MTTMQRPPQPDAIKEVMLPHSFSCEEMLNICGQQNIAWAEIEKLEKERESTLKRIERAIQAKRDLISQCATKIALGREERPTRVLVKYDPTAGTKTYYRPEDTAKTTPLATVPMEKDDYVLKLPGVTSQA